MANEITDDDLVLLGQLGVETEPTQVGGRSAKEQGGHCGIRRN